MKRITQEWVKKAEGDWLAAQQLYRARKHPNYDVACFLTQQCAEKYLKARLRESGIRFTKTHDLVRLLTLATRVEQSWNSLLPQVGALSDYAVDIRYPGISATKADAQQAIKDCREIRQAARLAFGLPL